MRIGLFSPFGVLSQESGLIFLLGNYLRRSFPDVVQLRCNGLFSLCDRDAEGGWSRSFQTCFRCMAEQREFAQWGGLTIEELSRHLEPADVELSRRVVTNLAVDELPWAQFEGQNLFNLALGSWQNRFNVGRPDLNNPQHEQVLRRFMLSAARAFLAARRFQLQFQPDLTIVAGTTDFISRAVVAAGGSAGRTVAVCAWDVSRRAVMVTHPDRATPFACELLLEGLVDMRADPATWSPTLTGILDELNSFLGLVSPPSRLAAGH